ncbi:MAG: diaminopimelate epimerase [Fimbriimonadaceae bacterium]|nr:diaminopimelate epimerase [Fimbriimonadaceae bacterium]
MRPIPFAKVQALRNTFALVETGAIPLEGEPGLAVAMARKGFGVGTDGLLVLGRREEGLDMRMYNPDGTPDFCGNGLRAAAWFAYTRGWIGPRATVQHGGIAVPTVVTQRDVTIELPPASFAPEDVPIRSTEPWIEQEVEGVTGTAVSTGSTHFVVFRDSLPEDQEFFSVSPRIEAAEAFPQRTSVMWAVREAEGVYRVRIWERGAGETLGCGTGSIAVAAVARRLHGAPAEILVHNPGGTLRYADNGSTIQAASAASIVFLGQWTAHSAT